MSMRDPESDGQGIVTEPRTLRIERLLPGPAERVWDYLTDPQKRGQWLAAGPMQAHAGGRVEHLFRHRELSHEETPARYRGFENSPPMFGEVTQWDPPRVLAYTWPGDNGSSEVTFELYPEGRDVLLVLTHRRLADSDTMVSVASGWDAHLGILIDRLKGDTPRGFWSTHSRLEAAYRERFRFLTEQGTTPQHAVRVEREFDATPAALYAAWTDLAVMNLWFGRVEADIRVGGSYRVESDGDDGEVYAHKGRYLALEPGRLVRMTFAVDTDEPNPYLDEFILISFHGRPEGRTLLRLDNGWDGLGPTEQDVEAAREGWSMWLDLLDRMFDHKPELRQLQ
jgi:uncharacterized protein YndB with AHSA1/START domain